mgnify:CR=1 FL=1
MKDKETLYKRLTQVLSIAIVIIFIICCCLISKMNGLKIGFDYYNQALYNAYLNYYELSDEYKEYKKTIKSNVFTLEVGTVMLQETKSEPIIYDVFTEDELMWLYKMVETETHGADILSKANVARVALNRIEDDRFPNTLKEVITQENQFTYHRTNITDDTKLACEIAFSDISNDAIWFQRSNITPNYAKEYLYTDNVGHSFFK